MSDGDRPSEPFEGGSILRKLLGRLQFLVSPRGDTSLRESLEDVLEEHGPSEPSLSKQERLMLLNILSFNELRVDDVMVPRADIKAIEEGLSLSEVLSAFSRAAHSRLPVYRDTLDEPLGMYHIKDLIQIVVAGVLSKTPDEQARALAQARRPVLFVPPSMPAIDLLIKMQSTRKHLALVIDEYGGTDGLVSIEDLVEEIVGDIEDKPGSDVSAELVAMPDGTFEADARLPIDDFEVELGVDLVPDEREEDLDTLGGVVVALVGRVPQRGEIIAHPGGLEFEVLDADPRRLKRLRVRRTPKEGEPAMGSGAESHGAK